MSRQINQPINQVRLTNVAVVRHNKGGKRFEIACYRNKVMDFRAGLETDLSEVLQTDRIFTNVSKGQFANSKDLEKAFGTRDEEEIAKTILEKGNSLQVSDLERNQQLQNTLSQIATWVASNCVHPDTGRPYTVSQIKHVLQKNYTVQTNKAIKGQYLDAVKYLKTVIPIERAKMEVSIQYAADQQESVDATLQRVAHTLVDTRSAEEKCVCIVHVDPSHYRELDELSKAIGGHLEILQQVIAHQGNADQEQELEFVASDTAASTVDTETHQLVESLRRTRIDKTGTDDDDDEEEEETVQLSRKAQRKAQKKNKKSQRRAQEETSQRLARQEKEKADQEERLRRIQQNPAVQANAATATGESRPCNTCGGSFPNAAAYRAHFRSDWHRFNQKLKLKGIPAVPEAEFLLCDAETFFGTDDS